VFDQAKTEWRNGSLVTLTWHACLPTVARTCGFDGGVKRQITADQFREIVTGGTDLNDVWRSRMAEVVPYLRQLKDAGIPVLWRPFHEMNESWNSWGNQPGANGGAKIFQQMRDYFDGHGLDNLIWVRDVQDNPAGGWSNYYPGTNYVDVVSLDVWYKGHPSASDYQQLQSIAGTKPIALAEMGKVPTASLLSSQPRWSYFMIWSEQLRGNNTDAEIRAAYAHPRVLNQGEIVIPGGSNPPPPRTAPITGIGGKCVDVAGANSANGTAVQLWDCNNSTAQRWTVGTANIIRALGKVTGCPWRGNGQRDQGPALGLQRRWSPAVAAVRQPTPQPTVGPQPRRTRRKHRQRHPVADLGRHHQPVAAMDPCQTDDLSGLTRPACPPRRAGLARPQPPTGRRGSFRRRR
jgi:mannan endo-1,4-beta-mannosidase